MAELAVKWGSHVTIIARDPTRLKAAEEKLKGLIPKEKLQELDLDEQKVLALSADVSSSEAAKAAVELSLLHFGRVDVLICCQGLSRPSVFEEVSESEMHEVMDVNYWGSVNMIKAALPALKKAAANGDGGKAAIPSRVVLVASQAAQVGVYGLAHYSASKFALRGLGEGLQQEFLPFNIRVCIVLPPDTDTPGLAEENKTKPKLTSLISQTSSTLSAEEVAEKAWEGVRAGWYSISCNFDGAMLNIATAGMSPQPSLGHLALEVLLAGFMRIVAVVTVTGFNEKIHSWHRKQQEYSSSAKSKGD
eukprot:TRINITY_DN6564_c0_g1_i1.p1 TRINITY_DN6564_c0_g1~~TRINITY_DN6564_c0_g1_i1.p1  ORF type:complete len:305 (+),score=95.90 TRINITY_DN6564_c0_g1_i1:1-915(+)